mgnify:FL=1
MISLACGAVLKQIMSRFMLAFDKSQIGKSQNYKVNNFNIKWKGASVLVSERNPGINGMVKISFKEKLAYGIGDFGCNMVYANLAAFLTYFYTDIVGISGAIIGSVILFSRIFDGFSDIVMGFVLDNTKHKYGKARPWVLRAAIPLAVTFVLLFSKPGFSETGTAIYLFIMYNLVTTIFYTMYFIPHATQAALITQDQYERSLLNLYRMILGTMGALLINIITIRLVNKFGGGAIGWRKTIILYAFIAAVSIIMSFYFTKERVTSKKKAKEKITLKEGFKALVANKYWRLVLLLGMVTYGIMALSGINIYYVTYVLGNQNLMGTLMVFYFASSIIGMIIVAPVVKKLGKRNTVFIGFFVYLIGTIVILLNPYYEHSVYSGLFVKGIGLAPLVGLLPSFVVDTIEYGEWKTGIRNEGLVYSSESFGQKFGNGVATAMLGWLLTLSGYVGGSSVQPNTAISAIIALFTYIPLILYTFAIIILYFYKLDKEYQKIVYELNVEQVANV